MKFKFLQKWIIYYLLLQIIKNECIEGCSSCGENNKCQLCDKKQGYFLEGTSCKKSDLENCVEYEGLKSCSKCVTNAFLDNEKCVVISPNYLIENCIGYKNIIACEECASGYQLKDSKCIKVENLISNCIAYQTDVICSECASGYIKDLNGSICLEIQKQEQCQTYANVECEGCKDNFKSENDFLQLKYQNLAESADLLERIKSLEKDNLETVSIEEKCFSITVTNCKTLDTFNTCIICNEGYFLKDKQCVLNPKDLIPFCFDYKTEKECSKCVPGYFLETFDKCTKNIPVTNCAEYSTSSNKTNCIKCLNTHFLKDVNICSERLNKVDLCLNHDIKKDNCQTCVENYQFTNDNLKCLEKTTYCKEYYPNTYTNTSLKCYRCQDGYYLKDSVCVEGVSTNCESFKRAENVCDLCENNYYLDPNNNCLKHDEILNCKDYSRVLKNKCESCTFNTVLFTKSSECLIVDLTGCDIHSSKDKCSRCDDGYMLNVDHTCSVLNSSLNCLRGEYDVCKLCNKGYILNSGLCSLPLNYLTKNCDANNLDGLVDSEKAVCETCKTNSIPLNYRGSNLCVKNETMTKLLGSGPVATCKSYKLNKDGKYQCDLCTTGKAVEGSTCVANCPADKSEYTASFSIKDKLINVDNLDFCGPKKDDCSVFGPLLDQKKLGDKINHGCLKCDTNFFMKLEYGNNGETGNTTIAKNPTNLFPLGGLTSNKFYGIGNFTCKTKTSMTFLGTAFGVTLDKCQYWHKMPNNEYGCTKCLHKYSGVVENYKIQNCHKYDEVKRECKECVPGFKFSTDPGLKLKCISHIVSNCGTTVLTGNTHQHHVHQKCKNCKTGFVLNDAGLCVTRTNSSDGNCEIFSAYTHTCEKCKNTHILNSTGICTLPVKANCLEYNKTSGHCIKCKDTFWIITAGNCTAGNIDDCLIYDQTPVANIGLSKCFQYKLKVPFLFKNKCSPVVTIDNCSLYSNKNTCQTCEGGYYLFSDLDAGYTTRTNCCIQKGKYGLCGGTLTTIKAGNHCSTFSYTATGTIWKCLKCDDNYHKDVHGYPAITADRDKITNNLTFGYKCVANKNYWSPIENQIRTKINLVDNTMNCDIYDFLVFKCVRCKTGYYHSKNKCCLSGTSGTSPTIGEVNINGTCEKINSATKAYGVGASTLTNATLVNCLKVDPSNAENHLCLECNETFGTPEFLTNGHCCIANKYYSTITSQCESIPANCKVFDEANQICQTCNSNFYKTSEFNNCCPDLQYSTGTSTCALITTLNVQNCKNYDRQTKKCNLCSPLFSWDPFSKLCIKTEKIYENCIKIETGATNTNKCLECEPTHFFHTSLCCLKNTEYFDSATGLCKTKTSPIENCEEHENNTHCRTCKIDSYLVNDKKNCCKQNNFWDTTKCVPILDRLGNCAFFNNTQKKCQSCAANSLKKYYLRTSGTRCCYEGYYENSSNACVAGTVAKNCTKYNASGVCTSSVGCEPGYYYNSSTTDACTVLPGNCLEADASGNCLKCSPGYIINGADLTKCIAVTMDNFEQLSMGTFHCKKGAATPSATEKCQTCSDFYVFSTDTNKVCCPAGYYYHNFKGCLQHDDKLCAEPTKPVSPATIANCPKDKCFLNKDYCTRHGDQTYKLVNGFFSSVTDLDFNYSNVEANTTTYYEANYTINNGAGNTSSTPCCAIGKYWNSTEKKCIDIPILNCEKYDGSTCKKCKSSHELLNGQCCAFNQIFDYFYNKCVENDSIINCPTGKYKSNKNCCLEKTYFDVSKNRCMPLFDQNCLESDNHLSCKKCHADYAYDSKHPSILKLYLNNTTPCINPNIKEEIYLCVLKVQLISTTVTDQIIPYDQMIFTTNYCKIFDFTQKKCTTCIDTAYQTADYPNCCENGFTGITVNGIKQCVKISLLMENCFNYDITNKKCRKCRDNTYHIDSGRCCANGTFLNRSTMECNIIDQPSCLDFNLTTSNCTKCKPNAYFSKGHCCDEGYFWNTSLSTPKCVINILTDCLIVSDNGLCSKCSGSKYLTNGGCCIEGEYWKGSACAKIDTEFTAGDAGPNTKGYKGCMKVDDTHSCIKCTGKSLANGRCCDDGKFLNTTCQTITVTAAAGATFGALLDCKAKEGDVCVACTGTKYTADNIKSNCCDKGQIFNKYLSTNTECSKPSDLLNCLRWHETNGCLLCSSDFRAKKIAATNKYTCVAKTTTSDTAGCISYDNTGACDKCNLIDYHGTTTCTQIANCVKIVGTTCKECSANFVLDNSDVCSVANSATPKPYPNCLKVDASTPKKCVLCNDYFYLDTTDSLCKPISLITHADFNNCLRAQKTHVPAYTCTKCSPRYFLATDKCAGTASVNIDNCRVWSATDKCGECENGYYLQNSEGNCCKEGFYYNTTDSKCKPIPYTYISNCDEYKIDSYTDSDKFPVITKCNVCASNYYPTNGGCCLNTSGKVWNGVACVNLTSDYEGVEHCKQIKDGNNECIVINNLANTTERLANCRTADYYLTNKHCCFKGKYWNTGSNKCDTINISLIPDCNQLDENGICVNCATATNYISDGNCCVTTLNSETAWNGTACATLAIATSPEFPGCKKFDKGKCLSCTTNYTLTDGCCKQTTFTDSHFNSYWDSSLSSCKRYPFGCKVFDKTTMKCTECKLGTDYKTPKACCALGSYYDEATYQCKLINTLSNHTSSECKKIFDSDVSEKICSGCDVNKFFIEDKCNVLNSYKIKDKYPLFDVISNCDQLNDGGYCDKCSSGFVKTGSLNVLEQVCCSTGKYFDGTECKAKTLTSCEIQLTVAACGKCLDTHYLLSNNTCHEIGKDGAVMKTPQCTEYDGGNCKKCKTGFNLFSAEVSVGLPGNAICCQNGNFFDPSRNKTTCLPLLKTVETCNILDFSDKKCKNCLATGYNSQLDHFCCLFNKEWNGTTTCTSIQTQVLTAAYIKTKENCKGHHLESKGIDTVPKPSCLICNAPYYLSDYGLCCQVKAGGKTSAAVGCIDIAADNLCNKWKGGKCSECDTTTAHMYPDNICCAFGKYLHTDGTCKSPTTNLKVAQCKIYDYVKESVEMNLLCKECNTNYLLSSDRKSCCATGQSINNTGNTLCLAEMDFPPGCIIFNPKTLQCTSCSPGYYLIDNICCLDTNYLKVTQTGNEFEKTCVLINTLKKPDTTEKYPNCIQLDNIKKEECKKCASTHKLRHSDKTCILIPTFCHFDHFNPETELCTKCIDTHYLTLNKCCQLKFYNLNGVCTAIPNNLHCIKYENGKCLGCSNTYYLLKNFCVERNKLINSTYNGDVVRTAADVQNCWEYGIYKECTRCDEDSGYSLLKLKDGKTYCLRIIGDPDRKCGYYNIIENSLKNEATCQKCQNHNSQNVLENYTGVNEEKIPTGLSVSGCEFYDIKVLLSNSNFICHKCQTNNLKYIDRETNTCKSRTVAGTSHCTGDASIYPIDKDLCGECATGYYLNEAKSCIINPTNCKTYDGVKILCIECNANYTLFYEKIETRIVSKCVDLSTRIEIPGPTWYPGYIPTCTDDSLCLSNVYENLKGPLEKLFSCHKCTDTTKIPFISYQGGKDVTSYATGIQRWNLSAINNSDDSLSKDFNFQKNEKSFKCLNPLTTDFNFKTGISKNFPTNCALGMINGNKKPNWEDGKKDNANLENLSIFCAACKPGFKPKRNSSFNPHIYECETISNCLTAGNGVNRCEVCNGGFSFGYKGDEIDYTNCVAWSSDTNCYAVDNTSVNNVDHKCKFCKINFTLNKDQKCVKYTPPYCQVNSFSSIPYFNPKNMLTGLNLLPNGTGCSQCESGYIGLFQHINNFVCTPSDYILAGNFISNTTVYDINCLKYGLTPGKLTQCKICKENFVITKEHKCVSKTDNLANCLIANNSSQCFSCAESFINVNYLCKEKEIENCKEYIHNPAGTEQGCLVCNDTFYLKENKCEIGTTENCEVYQNTDVCKKCLDGFSLYYGKNSERLCFPVTRHENCLQYNQDFFQNNDIQCQKCKNNDFILIGITDEYVCNPFTPIENCKEYDNQSDISKSSYLCLTCHEDFYFSLTTKKCVARTSIVKNCVEHSKNSLKCDLCLENYYLNDEKDACILNPEGVPGCGKYRDEKTCEGCDKNLYLYDNTCHHVPEQNLIENCILYINSEHCQKCIEGKILEFNKCIDPVNLDCLTYITSKECATCKPNWGIKDNNGLRTCVEIKPADNCSKTELLEPFNCVECSSGYYMKSENNCLEATTKIENCVNYLNTDTCLKCKDNNLLSLDGKKCSLVNITSNCLSFKQNKPFCVLCNPGYRLDKNRSCMKLSEIGLVEISNCTLYHSKTGRCLVCESGYFMDKAFNCVKNGSGQGTIDEKGGEGGNNQSFIGISYGYVWFLFVIALMF